MKETQLGHLPTEAINARTSELSRLPTVDALRLMNEEDQSVPLAVNRVLDCVAEAVDAIAARMKKGGHLFYIGAGTSGRLGVVDASECPPTFGTPPEWVQGIIAGGRAAMFQSQEGAEDVRENGARDLRESGFTAGDCVIGLAASGRTPYVLGALEYARSLGAWTGGITVNDQAPMKLLCDVFMAPVVGPEVLAGSTRLKAGTAQKLILNMISTGVMLRLGRVEGNLMTHLRPSCGKLVDRAARLIMNQTNCDEATAHRVLEECGGDVNKAVERLRSCVPAQESFRILRDEKNAAHNHAVGAHEAKSGMNTWRLMTYHTKPNLMFDWTRQNERIAIGWGGIGALTNFRSVEEIKAAIKAQPRYHEYPNAASTGPSLWDFYTEMQKGDLVILSTGKRELVVEVVGDYQWCQTPDFEGNYWHQRRVKLTTLNPEKVWHEAGASFPIGQSRYRTLLRCMAR